MDKANKQLCGLLLLGGILTISGCSNQDSDRLMRVGQAAAVKLEAATGLSAQRLRTGWHTIRSDLDTTALDARVCARLRWDRALTSARIQVQAIGSQVELRGIVLDLSQRRRAVELAESTVGVERVVDALEIPTQEP